MPCIGENGVSIRPIQAYPTLPSTTETLRTSCVFPGIRRNSYSFQTANGYEVSGIGRILFPKQRQKTGLLKMLVGGQCFPNAAIRHDHERNTIGESPFLVRSIGVESKSPGEKFRLQRQNFHIGVREKRGDKPDRGSPIALFGKCVAYFQNNTLRCHQPRSLDLHPRSQFHCSIVVLIARGGQRNRVCGVQKDFSLHNRHPLRKDADGGLPTNPPALPGSGSRPYPKKTRPAPSRAPAFPP